MKTYVVSGAGSGIGRAISVELAKEKHRVVLIGRNKNNLVETQSLMMAPTNHPIVIADVTDKKSLNSQFRELLKGTDVAGVVCNAGVGGPNTYGEQDRWHEVINTNLTGAYVLANEVIPYLKNSSCAFKHIIFISSILGKMGVPGYTAYCASKTGLLGLTRSLALELAAENILVNAICPGWVETKMAREGMDVIANSAKISFETVFKQQMQSVPLGKWSDPQEIAALVSYLLSPQQRSITGQAIDINNGAFMSQ